MPQVKIQTAKDPERVEYMYKLAKTEVANKIGIRGIKDLDKKGIQEIQDLMAKHKKPVDYYIDFDGEWFGFHMCVGSVRLKTGAVSVNVAQDNSIKDKDQVLKKLLEYKAATPALIAKYKKNNPIP